MIPYCCLILESGKGIPSDRSSASQTDSLNGSNVLIQMQGIIPKVCPDRRKQILSCNVPNKDNNLLCTFRKMPSSDCVPIV